MFPLAVPEDGYTGENIFPSFVKIQNVLTLACNISNGKKNHCSHAPSEESPAGASGLGYAA